MNCRHFLLIKPMAIWDIKNNYYRSDRRFIRLDYKNRLQLQLYTTDTITKIRFYHKNVCSFILLSRLEREMKAIISCVHRLWLIA